MALSSALSSLPPGSPRALLERPDGAEAQTQGVPAEAAAVSLQQMLDRREARVAAQQALLARHGRPLAQLTVVSPGPVKDTPDARFVFQQGRQALEALLAGTGLRVLARQQALLATGPEALWAVDGDALELKRQLVALEDGHPLGRLWDLDVLDRDGMGVSRQGLGLPVRTCLLCGQPAHACARSAAHALADLQRAIGDRVDAHRQRTAA